MPIYLGFDCSTQSLTAVAIEVEGGRRRVVCERALHFDRDLPAYGTANGVLRGDGDRLAAGSPPLMWAEALDRLLGLVAREGGFELARVAAVSGSAQQHGSVYLRAEAAARLATLDPARPLADQLEGLFTRRVSPVWMDSSTAAQCAAITAAVGGPAALARLTGSRAFERFTGPQIRKFFERDPDAYARTGRIHLVSSFLASLLGAAPGSAGEPPRDVVLADRDEAMLEALSRRSLSIHKPAIARGIRNRISMNDSVGKKLFDTRICRLSSLEKGTNHH